MTAFPERGRPESCLSDLILDRLIVGELTGKTELRTVEAHLAGCGLCRQRRAELEAEPAPAGLGWSAPVRAASRPGPLAQLHATGRRLWIGAAGLAIAAASVGLIVRARPPAGALVAAEQPGESGLRLKGPPFSLEVFVRRREGGSVEPVLPDSRLHEGDAVRFRLRVPAPGYLVVLGLDGAGQVSTYAPTSGDPIPIAAPGERNLEGSVILDGTLGPEQVVAVLCPAAAQAARALAAATAARQVGGAASDGIRRLGHDCLQAHASYVKTGQ